MRPRTIRLIFVAQPQPLPVLKQPIPPSLKVPAESQTLRIHSPARAIQETDLSADFILQAYIYETIPGFATHDAID